MVMVNADGSSQLSADSQPKSVGQVGWLATWYSVCIHEMNRVNPRNGYCHDDSTIVIIVVLLLTAWRHHIQQKWVLVQVM